MYPTRLARPLAIIIILVFASLAIGLTGGSVTGANASDNLTPTPTAPATGIEAPLGRYSEPVSALDLGGPSAPSLQSGARAPAMGTNFNGIGMESDSSMFIHTPPDTNAATGLDRIVEVTNGHVAIYNKSGGLIAGGDIIGAGGVDLNSFCAPVLTAKGCFDPKVIYDQAADRFVAVVLDGSTSSDSWLHIMVSKTSSPANLTTDWDKFVHSASTTTLPDPAWFDYPGLGVSPDAVVVTGNMFNDSSFFQGTTIRVFDKAELYDGDASATYVDIIRNPVSGGFTIQPAHHLSAPPSGTFYLFQRDFSSQLAVTALTGVPSSPAVNVSFLPTADQGLCVSDAPQKDTSKKIDTVCPRMMNAVYRDGSLWGTLTGSNSSNSRAVVQWFEVKTNNFPSSTPTLRQHGAIDAGSGENTLMPSISVDACKNAALTYTQSSSSRFPEMRYTARTAFDPLSSMQSPVVAKTSVSFYDDFSSGPERWGDYSSTVIDPSDGSFWITHEYARVLATGGGNNGRWGTWHANFGFVCPSFPDVPLDHWAWKFIESIFAAGLTAGFPDGTYGPDNPVTRAEMAVFLKKGIHGSTYTPPAPGGGVFTDTAGHWAEAWIEDLFDEGITAGFPDGTYRPENNVTRAEMAVFLLKAKNGSSYTPPAPGGGAFTDIAGHWAQAWIEQLASEGITSGFPDGTYRPENTATRAEMGVFLVNTFGLPLP